MIKILEEIDDKIIFKGYSREQVLDLVNEIVKIDLLAVKYETREEILYLLCAASSYYDISNCVNWASITDIKDKLEVDLKEYIKEIGFLPIAFDSFGNYLVIVLDNDNDGKIFFCDHEAALIARGRGSIITDALRQIWQAEIDKYSGMVQEEVMIED